MVIVLLDDGKDNHRLTQEELDREIAGLLAFQILADDLLKEGQES